MKQLNSNGNSNSGWRNTKIQETQAARSTDPFHGKLRHDWWLFFNSVSDLLEEPVKNPKLARSLHRSLDKLVARDAAISKRRSIAMDSDGVGDFDAPSLEWLSSLRSYFSNLKPNERLRVATVRMLLGKIKETI